MEIVKLKDICETKNPTTKFKKTKHGIPVLNIKNFINKDFITFNFFIDEKKFNELKINKLVPYHKDILISRVGTIGEVFFINKLFNMYITDNFIWLTNFNKNKVIEKYLYFVLKTKKNIFKNMNRGSTQPLLVKSDVLDLLINIPKIHTQQQIIDIIEPKEELFIKYNNLIRIDDINDFKNDWQVLIDIIEPFELLLEEINQKINKIKNILRLNYIYYYSNEFTKIVNIIKIHNDKYKGQKYYFATNGIGEFEIDYNKVIDISEKKPSRANLTPKENSLIFSKLIGENKVLYIDKTNDYVFSTGFYNITTKYIDFVAGFLLSKDFIEQKSKFSNGTTMIGLNLEGLNKIEMKKPKKEGSTLILFMNNLIKQKYLVEKIIKGLIEKYIH